MGVRDDVFIPIVLQGARGKEQSLTNLPSCEVDFSFKKRTMSLSDTSHSVSYTHLDVYKRQVLLYLKKSGLDRSGLAPIMGRITYGRTIAQFSCKLSCDPKLWNARESRPVSYTHLSTAYTSAL